MYSSLSSSLVFLGFLFRSGVSQLTGSASTPTVTIDSGPVFGRATQLPGTESPVNQFLGIPFAKPPVGDLRFSPPQQPEPWTEAYNATSQPNGCMQYVSNTSPSALAFRNTLYDFWTIPGQSEDCLYLNVYAPSGGETNKPVLFWIYGGSGLAGAISQAGYNGTDIAANHDIVVIAANYRVNVFGTPRSPQLPFTERNPGLLDQHLALDWVQRNIHVFGGDPEKVTIVGESAGAVSVGNLINTHPVNPPFRGAIMQSGSALIAVPPGPPNSDTSVWDALIEQLNCTDTSDAGILACARAVPATTIQNIIQSNGIVFGQNFKDNVTAMASPAGEYMAGNVSKVPILIGSNTNDGTAFTLSAGNNVTAYIEASFGAIEGMAPLLEQLYAPGAPAVAGLSTAQQIIGQILTDAVFRCSSGLVANETSTFLDVPVWQYVFDAQVPSNTFPEYPDLGVYHSSEIRLIWGTYPKENSTPAEANLSRSLQKQFTDFVKDPQSGPGWSQWPEVAILGVNETDAVTTTENVAQLDAICAYWNQFYDILLAAQLNPATTTSANGTDTANSTTTATATTSASDTAIASTTSESTNAAGETADGSVLGALGAALLGFVALL